MNEENEISFFEVVKIIKKKRVLIVSFVLLCTSVSYTIAKMKDPIYQAQSVILPIGGGGGMGGMFGGFLPGAMLGGFPSQTNSVSKLILILESHTFAQKLAERLESAKKLHPNTDPAVDPSIETIEAIADTLSGMVKVEEDTMRGVLAIKVEAKDPILAADLANDIVNQLWEHIQENQFSEAKRDRVFIGHQLEAHRKAYLEAGKFITNYYGGHRISPSLPELTVDVGIDLDADVVADITNLNERTVELNRQKNGVDKVLKQGIVEKLPQQIYLDYLTLQRTILGGLNSTLAQQYEIAKINEKKEDLHFQVIDKARIPTSIYKPKTRTIVLITFLISVFFIIFTVIFLEYFKKSSLRQA